MLLGPADVEDETVFLENNEMWAACREAQACGARILLGDRDHEVWLMLVLRPRGYWDVPVYTTVGRVYLWTEQDVGD